jgi:membrane-associated phospholipid phosphatase
MKYFFTSLPKNILKCFTGYNLLWQLFAIIITFILVTTNIDWYYFVHTRIPTLNSFFFPAVILGGILPLIIPVYLVVAGYFSKKKNMEIFGWAIGQAALIGAIISDFYKFFTGRIQPNLLDITNNISHNFNFGILKHGVFWGWPSSHTTIAFAMAFALIYMFPKNKIIKFFAILYAFYVGIGVSLSIHWLSDFLAGAIFGTIIGIPVGLSFKTILLNQINIVKK